MSLKNSDDTIGNRTRNLPVCSAVPHVSVVVELFMNTNHMCHIVMTATIWEATSMERTMLVGAIRKYVWSDKGKGLLLFIIIIIINCNWVVTRWQYTITHKQYILQNNNNA